MYKSTQRKMAKVAALQGAPMMDWVRIGQRRPKKAKPQTEPVFNAPVTTYCISIGADAFERRIELKSWGFKWSPPTKTWIRLLPDLGKAKGLARDMRDRGYTVSLHKARSPEMPKPRDPKPDAAGYGPQNFNHGPGIARSYRGSTGAEAHRAGDNHGWHKKRAGHGGKKHSLSATSEGAIGAQPKP